MESRCYLNYPPEIIFIIFSCLSPKNALSLDITCKQFNLIRNNYIRYYKRSSFVKLNPEEYIFYRKYSKNFGFFEFTNIIITPNQARVVFHKRYAKCKKCILKLNE